MRTSDSRNELGRFVTNVETLEDRRLFASATLASTGVLTVNGAAALSNTIVIAESTDGTKLNVAIAATGSSAAVNKTFTTANVKRIVVNGGGAADIIKVGQTGKPTLMPTVVWAGLGNDTIKTGAGNDTIHGGKGNDLIYSNAGRDVVFGYDGNDSIYGGKGNDTLWGGGNKDTIYGEDGDDFIGGFQGVNAGYGGLGKDTFYVASTLTGSFPVNDFQVDVDVLKIGPEPTAE